MSCKIDKHFEKWENHRRQRRRMLLFISRLHRATSNQRKMMNRLRNKTSASSKNRRSKKTLMPVRSLNHGWESMIWSLRMRIRPNTNLSRAFSSSLNIQIHHTLLSQSQRSFPFCLKLWRRRIHQHNKQCTYRQKNRTKYRRFKNPSLDQMSRWLRRCQSNLKFYPPIRTRLRQSWHLSSSNRRCNRQHHPSRSRRYKWNPPRRKTKSKKASQLSRKKLTAKLNLLLLSRQGSQHSSWTSNCHINQYRSPRLWLDKR